MFRVPEDYRNISLKLSEVLGEIGINEQIVLSRRRSALIQENMGSICTRILDEHRTIYYLGSKSEGTTTLGLNSDSDYVFTVDTSIVTQDWCEWTPGKANYLMIQDETTPPGYCLLQRLYDNVPLPSTQERDNFLVKDTRGRIICKNTIIETLILEGEQREGPSMVSAESDGSSNVDRVLAFPCSAWPQSYQRRLFQQETEAWPTEEMKRYAKSSKCFVVATGNRASESETFEWRISTSLAERCLMFNLNITQMRCYVLMKMIIKTHLKFDNESYISSFMCKNVLFYSIRSTPFCMWKDSKLLNCLTVCLLTLRRFIFRGNCPHFIVHENNLLAGKYSNEVKHKLLGKITNLIPCHVNVLYRIQFDDLGQRLQHKLNIVYRMHGNIAQACHCNNNLTLVQLHYLTGGTLLKSHQSILLGTEKHNINLNLKSLSEALLCLFEYNKNGSFLEKAACKLLTPVLCTSFGTMLASYEFQRDGRISTKAMSWFNIGLNSDVASSKLKLASVLYCTGNVKRSSDILDNVKQVYDIKVTQPICGCYKSHTCRSIIKPEFRLPKHYFNIEGYRNNFAFCVTFRPSEINCIPYELQYEMFRSTKEEMTYRSRKDEDWMSLAVVDSLPYLYFLQYKTNSHLQRPMAKQLALIKLEQVIATEPNFEHRETALNLLGQCLEQENKPIAALQCYMQSLRIRERNNAAKIHICMCLAKLFASRRS